MIGALILALWCGVLWRVRGGAWETLLRLPATTIGARLACAAAIAGAVWPLLPLVDLPFLAAALFLGMVLPGWGDAMDIGRVSGTRWGDAASMSAWGVVAVLPAAIVLCAWPLLLAGLAFGPIYALAWHLPRLPRLPRFAEGPTEWAEVAAGAALGLALWVTLA